MKKIAIHSVPRSGSTWLGEILNSSPDVKYCFQPLFSYQFKDFLNESSPKEDITSFFSLLSVTDDDFVCQKAQREVGTLPNVKKSDLVTHVIYKEVRYHHIIENLLSKDESIKTVFLVRDPLEVMNSWINAPKEFNPSWDVATQLFTGELKNLGRKENFFGLGAWVKTTLLFENLAKKYPERVMLINYVMLERSLEQTVRHLYEFCELPLTEATYNFLRNSREQEVLDTYSVFRGGNKSKISINKNLMTRISAYVSEAGLSRYISHQVIE